MAQSEKLPFVLPHADDPNTHKTTSNKQQKYHKYFVLATCSAYLVLDVVASYLDHTVNNNHDLNSLFFSDAVFLVVISTYALVESTPLTHRLLSNYVLCIGWLLPLITVLGPFAVDWAKGRKPNLSFGYGSLGEQVSYCRDEPYTQEQYGELFGLAVAKSHELGLPIMETISVCIKMTLPKSKLS
ncbi:hypothetical protein BGZ92_006784, partial [Podila epicladia]